MKMPLDLKTKESRIFILTAVAAVLALVFYFRFLIQPQAAGLVEIFSKTGSISSEIRSARSEIERIDGFKRDLDKYKETVEKYEKKLPVEHEIPTLLQSLSDMAKTSSIKILSIPHPKKTRLLCGYISGDTDTHNRQVRLS
jgi:Tfp pilus assembly protein PilO